MDSQFIVKGLLGDPHIQWKNPIHTMFVEQISTTKTVRFAEVTRAKVGKTFLILIIRTQRILENDKEI